MSQLNMSLDEEWRPVVGYEGFYSVSNLGRIRSEDRDILRAGKPMRVRERILLQNPNRKGHKTVLLYGSHKKHRVYVHRIVVLAFSGSPPSPLHEVAHNDGDAANNHISNLRWATRSENHGDKVGHGTHLRNERHPLCKLSVEDVLLIRSSALTNSALAKQYGTCSQHISSVRRGKKRNFV